jgi:large subunit ribosomal protein L23
MAKPKKGKKLKSIDPDENPFEFIYHPYVTEKTMNLMERLNRLEFVVARGASKTQIKIAFEKLYNAKVDKINTRILKDGKHAIIKLKPEYSAEEIGMRIGIF